MKSPADLTQKLARQWHNAVLRKERLLSSRCWPLQLSIGKPSASQLASRTTEVLQHVNAWRKVTTGRVDWQPVNYRASAEPLMLPVCWVLRSAEEWITASADAQVSREFRQLESIAEQSDVRFHPLLLSQRALWQHKSPQEVIQAVKLAASLEPGCAQGQPLRLLAGHGVDTKFFERNSTLITRLLDERFDGEASALGLATFLDAFDDTHHWVLLKALAPGLLPFEQCRVTTAELARTALPGTHLLVVENEQCIHQLPPLAGTLAILGAGLDLQWLHSPALAAKTTAYWGDMDSWGLLMLSRARAAQPTITPLLMNQPLFDRFAPGRAVHEPVTAAARAPEHLLPDEQAFYRYLLAQPAGRLEQEFLPREVIRDGVGGWRDG